MTVSVQ